MIHIHFLDLMLNTSAMWYAKNELYINCVYAKKKEWKLKRWYLIVWCYKWKYSEKEKELYYNARLIKMSTKKTRVVRPNTYSSLSCIVFFSVVIINDNIAFGLKLSLVVLPPLGEKQWRKKNIVHWCKRKAHSFELNIYVLFIFK